MPMIHATAPTWSMTCAPMALRSWTRSSGSCHTLPRRGLWYTLQPHEGEEEAAAEEEEEGEGSDASGEEKAEEAGEVGWDALRLPSSSRHHDG